MKINTICVATDFSQPSRRAYEYAAELARRCGARLHVLHVLTELGPASGCADHRLCLEMAREYFNRLREHGRQEGPSSAETATAVDDLAGPHVLENLERETQRQFQELAAAHPASPPAVEAIRFGSPVEELVDYVRRQGVDLLVVGKHGRTAVGRLLLGGTAEGLVRACPCPVLSISGENESA